MRSLKVAAVATALVLAAGSALGVASADPTPSPPPPGPPPAPKTTIDADGTYQVGTDIAPGTYASAGPVGDGVCYWKRADATNAMLDNAMTKKPQVVAITPTDASFKTSGCQAWQLTDAAPPSVLPPMLSGLKMQGYLALINGMAAGAPAAPPPDPAAAAPGPAPGPAPEAPTPAPLPAAPVP